jgi:hypothetical protein
MTDDERNKAQKSLSDFLAIGRGFSGRLLPSSTSDDPPSVGNDAAGGDSSTTRAAEEYIRRPTGTISVDMEMTELHNRKFDELFKPFHEDTTIMMRMAGGTITGRIIPPNLGVFQERVNPSLIRAQREYNHYAAVDVEITKILMTDFHPIEERLMRHYRKLRGKKRYLKRYHRIGAMMRPKGYRMNIRVGQYVQYRNEWAYVWMVDEKQVGLSGWRGVKTKVISRAKVQAVKDKM